MHVLIINAFDERDMYAEALRNAGLIVTTAISASEGIERLTTVGPDVVIQRMAFADRTGFDLAAELLRIRPSNTTT